MSIRTTYAVRARESSLSFEIPAGDDGARLTVAAMAAIVHAADRIGDDFDRFCDAFRYSSSRSATARALFFWLKQHFRFRRDPERVEYLRTVDQMLEDWYTSKQRNIRNPGAACIEGDCDELAIFGAACLRRVGLPAFLVLMSQGEKPFSHVYFATQLESGAFAPLDPQETPAPFVERVASRRERFAV